MNILMKDKVNHNVIKIFPSFTEAAKFLGKVSGASNISKAAHGKRKTAYGYEWELIDSNYVVKVDLNFDNMNRGKCYSNDNRNI